MIKKYTYDQYFIDLTSIKDKMIAVGYIPNIIIGLSRGGLIPGVHLSHMLGCKFHPVGSVFPQVKKTDKVLVIDDINDTGQTLQTVSDYLEKLCDVQYAVLLENEISKFKNVKYYGSKINKTEDPRWIEFWWEY
jgi:hypoxanthine phosphoribosyltransferase